MKSLVLSLVVLFSVGLFSAGAVAEENAYFQIKKVTFQEVPDSELPALDYQAMENFNDCNTTVNNNFSANPVEEINVMIDKIVNLGKKVWDLVKMGTPVVNLKMDKANALPMGVKCWSDLAGWEIPKSKSYRVQYENGFGMTVVDFAFRVVFTAGGNYNEKGKYVANATFQPAEINVQWGFNLDATAEVPQVFNRGTKENPIAGMQMTLKWDVSTAVTHMEQTETFYVGGDNKLVHLK